MTAPNSSPIFVALVDPRLPPSGDPDPKALADASDRIAEANAVFSAQPINGDRGEIISAELCAACGLADLGLTRLAGDEPTESEFAVAAEAQRDA